MADIVGKLTRDPRKPTAPLDKDFATEIYGELKELYGNVKC